MDVEQSTPKRGARIGWQGLLIGLLASFPAIAIADDLAPGRSNGAPHQDTVFVTLETFQIPERIPNLPAARNEAIPGSIGILERKNKKIAFGVGLTASTGPDDTNFYAHLELPLFKYVQLFASFLRVNAESPAKIFEATTDNMVVLSGLRAQLLPFLFINGRYQRLYQITCRGECHIGNSNVVDADGNTSPFFRSERIYNIVQTVFVDVEIGWEFKD